MPGVSWCGTRGDGSLRRDARTSAYVATLKPNAAGLAAAKHLPGELERVVAGLERESLSPVARWTAVPDLLSMLCPVPLSHDRGRVLEPAWERNTSPKGREADSPLFAPFRGLAEGERNGWRPSLILSPMIVPNPRPMLISNLDLKDLNRHELFKIFANETGYDADHLKISTAVRMNAAFPLVTPAVSLPTDPPRRVVDAGYFDNYGVSVAAAWVTHNLHWLSENTGGVLLVQIPAYPVAADAPGKSGPLQWLGNSMQWLTTPLESYAAAGRQVMLRAMTT